MATRKLYGDPDGYERKLANVMDRLHVEDWDYSWGRKDCWVQFKYKGQIFRFVHSLDKAAESGQKLVYGSDVFAQLVLTLEDLARMVERGIYDLSQWVAGMAYLPPVADIPSFFRFLKFEHIPVDVEEVKVRYRALAKQMHPDAGGNAEDFQTLQRAFDQATKYLTDGR